MSRLNDTRAIVSRPIEGGNHSCPDAGAAMTARRNIPGMLRNSYYDEKGDLAGHLVPEPGVGGEGLRSAVMCLKGGKM